MVRIVFCDVLYFTPDEAREQACRRRRLARPRHVAHVEAHESIGFVVTKVRSHSLNSRLGPFAVAATTLEDLELELLHAFLVDPACCGPLK